MSYFEFQIQSRSMSDPTLSGIDLKIKWLGSRSPLNFVFGLHLFPKMALGQNGPFSNARSLFYKLDRFSKNENAWFSLMLTFVNLSI